MQSPRGTHSTVEKAFEASAGMLVPLGLEMTERPRVGLNPRIDRPGYSARMVGRLIMRGERHGRRVSVRREGGGATVTNVSGAVPSFEIKSDGNRLRAAPGAPPEVGRALGSLTGSKRWKGLKVSAGDDGLAVRRRSDSGFDWLCDLWLAERLADELKA